MASGFSPVATFSERLEGREVDDAHGGGLAVAGETVAELGHSGETVDSRGAGDFPDDRIFFRIDDDDFRGVGDVQPMSGGLDREIVPAAVPADRDFFLETIRLFRADESGETEDEQSEQARTKAGDGFHGRSKGVTQSNLGNISH